MPTGSASSDPDQRVCYCMRVSLRQIEAAIANGARTLAELQAVTRAGTGCGTCRFDLLDILARASVRPPSP